MVKIEVGTEKERRKKEKETQRAIMEFQGRTHKIAKIPMVIGHKIPKLSRYFLIYTRVLQLKFRENPTRFDFKNYIKTQST